VLACEADSGVMGGSVSHEFMAPADIGEDTAVRCTGCVYAANREAAKCEKAEGRKQKAEEPKPIEEVATPGKHTVEQVSQFLKVPAMKLIKTLLYDIGEKDHVAVLIRGDHEVNEAKLARLLKSSALKLSSAQAIERLSGGPVGFTGPVKLDGVRLVVDHAVTSVVNAVTGANASDRHLINVNPGRDFTPTLVADIRYATTEDACPRCGKRVELLRAIEVGHVFQLGTKYTQTFGAMVQDAGGAAHPMIMGCYGIGVNRIVAAAIEQRHDADGILWPAAISPFHVVISVLEAENPAFLQLTQELEGELARAGYEALVDDRVQSPGSKLKDADLIGIPVQIIIGKTWAQSQRLEVVERAGKSRHQVERPQCLPTVKTLLDKLAPRL
ncbi:MAG: proline--tRNA ligase, partial [Candidatus Omnitrophica bacterium]|nr:proline--tRNA ligase [Candidatus Omnitrophota bacterium]